MHSESLRPRAALRRLAGRPALWATVAYALLALVMTWPLLRGLTRDAPSDIVDPLLNSWILAWDADHMLRFLSGDLAGMDGVWDANIFHPRPRTLAYSEHLFPQAAQILPVYALTRNPLLCHNLLFLSTFILSGLGMFLLVRALTGDVWTAFLGGLLFAFAPYRLYQIPHVQVMSSQWMPFVLLGLHRYFESRRPIALVGAVAALVAQNLSCGYFLFYFAPFAAAWALFELVSRGRLGDLRAWFALVLAAAATVALTLPFLLPYVEARQYESLLRERWTVEWYSADVYGYLTANPLQRLWGPLLTIAPRPEGFLFPSFVPLGLGAWAVVAALRRRWHERREGAPTKESAGRWALLRRLTALVALAIVVWEGARIGLSLLGLAWTVPSGWFFLFGRGFSDAALRAALALAVAWWASPRLRAFTRGGSRSLVLFLVAASATAFVFSLGPTVTTLGHRLWVDAPYAFLYHHVPGFDGLRVPARLAMVVVLFLSLLAAIGAHELQAAGTPRRRTLLLVLGAFFLIESAVVPMRLNGTWSRSGLWRPRPLTSGAEAPDVYRFVDARLPQDAVLLELPIGDVPHDTRYMYHSTTHWRRLVNGFSGHFPESYQALAAALDSMPWNMERGWGAVLRSGATHVIVHEDSWRRKRGQRTTTELIAHGARPLARFGDDVLLEVPTAADKDGALAPLDR